jgi:hypothetical protein
LIENINEDINKIKWMDSRDNIAVKKGFYQKKRLKDVHNSTDFGGKRRS